MRVSGSCATEMGNTRGVNQDSIFFRSLTNRNQHFALGIVCDGVGGLTHGELASGMVTEAAFQWFSEVAAWIDIETVDWEVLFSHFRDAAEEWNRLVRETVIERGIQMGTTMSALLLLRERYYIIQVGDSRVYQYHNGLRQLTTDACVTRIQNGKIKQYLSNYMGKNDTLWFTTAEGILREGDMFLYGSDGFYHFLTEEDVTELYRRKTMDTDLHAVCKELIASMLQRGEKDNISVGIICLDKDGGTGLEKVGRREKIGCLLKRVLMQNP